MANVLVFPCGSEIGLELWRSLSVSTHFTLFGASSVPDHGRFVYERYHEIESMADADAFPAEFNALLKTLAIDYVFPAHDAAVVRLADLQDRGELWAEAVVPGFDVCALCRSKRATYRLLGDVLATPGVIEPDALDDAVFPLFGKPDVGQGSHGAEPLPDIAAAREKLRREPGTVLLEYLPGAEYTVDCFTDARGRLLFQSARERVRTVNGISSAGRVADHPSLLGMGLAINERLRMRGAWFFQARENARGDAVLLEVAPRIGGGSGFQRVRGVNLALLSLFDRMDQEVRVYANPAEGLEMDRALSALYRLNIEYRTVYIDFDDTVYLEGRGVNADVVKFLFQCRNREVRLVLLTRHVGDIREALAACRLEGVFDEVVHVPAGASKAEYILESAAIFIDDSFVERLEVSEACGIPVFDPSALEALFDERA